jgi:hypothetical protein
MRKRVELEKKENEAKIFDKKCHDEQEQFS